MALPLIPIPADATCQEQKKTSVLARMALVETYCDKPATCIVYCQRTKRGLYMCDACTDLQLRVKGGLLVSCKETSPHRLKIRS